MIKELVSFISIGTRFLKERFYMVRRISGHANLLKAISISFIAGGLIFEGLRGDFQRITGYSAIGLGA